MRCAIANRKAESGAWRAVCLLLAAALVMSLAMPASAVTITNVTTSTPLFSDNFEGVPAISAGLDDDDGSTDFDPVATVGTWGIVEADSASHIQVTDFSGETSTMVSYPGAFEGDNYMWINRPSGAPFNQAQGTLSSPQTTAGHVIHAEFMAYIRSTGLSGGPGLFNFYEGDATSTLVLGVALSNSDKSISGVDPDDLTWAFDKWQKWEVDYVLGASTYSLTLDGVTVSGIAVANASTTVSSFRHGGRVDWEYFIDSVPEPNSLAMLSIGSFALFARRKRAKALGK